MDPAGGLTEPRTGFSGFALQQRDLACGRCRLRTHAGHAAARVRRIADAPLASPRILIERGRGAIVREELGDIEADAARTDDRDATAYGP